MEFSLFVLQILLTEMSMDSEPDVSMEEVTGNRSFPAGKKGKVPRRKAEREKLKREQLNELFLELASALELSQTNTGKASILCETTRLLKDLLTQIESLKKDNVALYLNLAIPPNFPGDSFRLPALDASAAAAAAAMQQAPAVFVVPIRPDHVQGLPMTTSNVRKPHARYPTATDSWPKEVQFRDKDSGFCNPGER
ncbi:transcription factor bHLH [Salix suchowensis]|nr:transcription factor bHLH [Salix suchowensis]